MTDKAHNMVTVTDGHIEYVAEYFVNDEMITVNAAHEHKTTQLGGSAPDELAKMLLGELIKRRQGF
jgi:hypothetical protein